MSVRIIVGDCREILKTLPDESVHCVVTSPPYWGLRDYGVEGQIGLEESPFAWLDAMVSVFAEVRRVLRVDGTAWVNMGDSYATGTTSDRKPTTQGKHGYWENPAVNKRIAGRAYGLKAKDLIGQPWMLALALRADGWWLRSDIIWHKPNPMPESITDRPTKSHEYVFLLTRSERYYYDADAIKELASENTHERRSVKMPDGWDTGAGGHGSYHRNGREKGKARKWEGTPPMPGTAPHKGLQGHSGNNMYRKLAASGSGTKNNESFDEAMTVMPDKRNKRSVWTIPTHAFPEAHFATFPPALIEPCILAGCPWGGVVLDPFGGAGTTGLVADRHGRDAILIELNPQYADMAERRIRGDAPLFSEVTA